MSELKTVPITLITGYLGSGKTTLVNHILKNAKNHKMAVIVNDLGEVNIDAELLEKGGIVSSKDDNLVLSFNSFIYNINLAYRMEVDNNKYVSLSYITNAYSDLLKFLGNFYLRYSPNINCIHFDYNEVLRLMSEKKRNDFKQMVNLMKVDTTKECAKLMLWFIDDYINNLTINVLSRIDIDYYEFVKWLFIK